MTYEEMVACETANEERRKQQKADDKATLEIIRQNCARSFQAKKIVVQPIRAAARCRLRGSCA